jgi:hypothetical protein
MLIAAAVINYHLRVTKRLMGLTPVTAQSSLSYPASDEAVCLYS